MQYCAWNFSHFSFSAYCITLHTSTLCCTILCVQSYQDVTMQKWDKDLHIVFQETLKKENQVIFFKENTGGWGEISTEIHIKK